MCNQHYACFSIQTSRSAKAFLVMISDWEGVVISDDYAVYVKWPHGRQSCLSHLIRAARKLSEDPDPQHAKAGKWLKTNLQQVCKRKGGTYSQSWVEATHKEFQRQAKKYFSNVGGDTKKLIDRIDAEFSALMYFLTRPGLEPTNNHAERTIRPAVVLRKTCSGQLHRAAKPLFRGFLACA